MHFRASDAAMGPLHPAHFEQISKIAGKIERNPDLERLVIVVLHAKPLIGFTAPEKECPHHVQHIPRLHEFPVHLNVGIGEIDGED
ncbi:hypothetical protein CRBSH125_21980 [Afipia carboxidovorans]|nr:hypothetical protein CRBSH125_21980 [Afipia carboxidovorans]